MGVAICGGLRGVLYIVELLAFLIVSGVVCFFGTGGCRGCVGVGVGRVGCLW